MKDIIINGAEYCRDRAKLKQDIMQSNVAKILLRKTRPSALKAMKSVQYRWKAKLKQINDSSKGQRVDSLYLPVSEKLKIVTRVLSEFALLKDTK